MPFLVASFMRRFNARAIVSAAVAVCSTHAVAGEHYKPEDVGYVVNTKGANSPVTNGKGEHFVVGRPVAFGVTPPLRDQPRDLITAPSNPKEEGERNENERVKISDPTKGHRDQPFLDPLATLQVKNGPQGPAMPTPSLTFAGVGNPTACNGCIPPDTNGDVGPNHYVQAVNTRVNIYSKTGTAWATGATLQSTAFFGGLPAGNSCRNSDDGDPVVLYDSLADRWLISQFEVDDVPGHQCIAISQTPDPTGAWYAYDFVMPNSNFQDYPHYGVWPDGYYLTTNQFNQAGTEFLGAGTFAFDRVKMLAGDATASYIYHDVYTNDVNAGGMLPSDVDGFVPPPAGLPNRIMEFRSQDFGDPLDAIRTYELVPNYATPASSTFTIRSDVALADFDSRAPNSRNLAETTAAANAALDAIADRLMFRLAYRNLGTPAAPTNSWVGNFTVNVSGVNPTAASSYQAAIRWFELRSSDTSTLQTVRDQGTHANGAGNGATGINNWMGSAAQDNQGNIALGYSASSTTQNANIMIAARTGASTGVGLNQGEAVFFAATGAQTDTAGRWGDYSAMSVDPVDECTFWYTQEYYAAPNSTRNFSTRIGKFILPGCTAPPRGYIAANITDCASSSPISGVTVSIDGGISRTTKADGTLQSNIGTAPASYTVTASKKNYSQASGSVNVTDGNTVTFTGCLSGQPLIAASSPVAITAENGVPANNAVDPGETVTVNLPLVNTGIANTTNLVATLQSSAQVTAPSGPQTYGVVVAGGAAVAKPFTFTAQANCGDSITLTLDLQDGASNLGTVTYTVPTGTTSSSAVLSENFDGVTAPALPAGWTTAITGTGAVAFVGSTTNSSSPANAAYAPDVATVTNSELVSPSFNVPNAGGQVTFRNLFNMESGTSTGYDGMVLELSVNGGAFADITTGGNAFSAGGYTKAISSAYSNPIAGRQAWSGLSGGTTAAPTYITSTINLPASAAGQPVKLKWRAGTDNSAIASGQNGVRVDSLVVTGYSHVCAAVNTAPTVTSPGNQTINEDTPTSALNVTVGDAQTAAGSLTLTASSSDTTLIPNANIALGGSGAARTVTVTPAANANGGPVTITLTVSDGSLTGTSTFDVTVTPMNDAPTVSSPGNQTIDEDTSTAALNVTVGDVETAAGSLTLTATSSNTTLIPNANLVIGGSGATRTVTVTPVANGNGGPVTITLKVDDGSVTSTSTFDVTVTPVNDAPSATAESIALNQGATATVLVGGATSVLANDSDVDVGDVLSAVVVTGPAHASSFTLNPDGSFSYAHDDSSSASDSFVYKTCDNAMPSLCSADTTVTIGVNLKPVAGCSVRPQLLAEGDVVNLALAGEFSDPESQTLTFGATGLPGGLSINAGSGQLTGTVAAGANTGSPFTAAITATDTGGAALTRNLVIQVLANGELVFRNGFDNAADATACQ